MRKFVFSDQAVRWNMPAMMQLSDHPQGQRPATLQNFASTAFANDLGQIAQGATVQFHIRFDGIDRIEILHRPAPGFVGID
ncbi:hypothetical protein [Novosphingobium sp. 17-62-19]|uniref:hypothetical protein n=1 Tax=Novosphingobium sp. 17-62-19 TaxID=1970406 RepID=UPI0025E3F02C|nr:hypothetical protein [Novosphingobium sp. 17-62-19]